MTDGALPPGTNRFRAPEAVTFWKEHKLDYGARYAFRAADDQYALAVCLYDALTDAETAKDPEQRAARRITVNSPALGSPPAPRAVNPRVPSALSTLVAQAVEHDTTKRLATLEALRSALEALAEAGDAEWEAPVFAHATSGRAQPENTATRGQARRKVAAAGAVIVAAAAALALLREPSLPPGATRPPAPTGGTPARAPTAPPPSPAAPPGAEVPSSASEPPAQKETPTVRVPKPPSRQLPPQKPRLSPPATFTPEFLARCAGLSLIAAAKLGCPPPQVRPEREVCSEEAVDFMRRMDFEHGQTVFLTLDVNQPGGHTERGVYRTGRYTGAIGTVGGRVVERGWRVEGYLWTEGKLVKGRFTKMYIPAGTIDAAGDPLPREVPICMVMGDQWDGAKSLEGSKPGAVALPRMEIVRVTFEEWTQP